MNNIGQAIKERRKQLGLTQKDFATFANLGYRFVKELEEGKQTVRLDKVEQALQFLGLELNLSPVDYVVTHKNTPDGVIINCVIETCKKHGVKHLYLYGSYAKKLVKPGSDFDFAIEGFEGKINELVEDIENIRTLKEIDVVEYDKIANANLKEEIDRYGRKIY